MHRQSSINRSAFNDSEARSLRRSFSSIHQQSSHRTSPTSPLDNDDDMDNNCNTKKKESIRRKSHHHHSHGSGPSRRISMDTTSGDEKQLSSAALPYANNNKAERHTRHSHPTSNNKTKPHRRASYTGITAQTAQEMVAEMLNDKSTTSSSNNAHHHQSSSHGHTITTTRQKQQKAQQQPPRRVTVSFGPTKEQLQQLRNSTQTQYEQQLNHNNSMPDIHNNHHPHHHQSHNNNPPQRQHMGYRPDYKLGQVARSPSHLLLPPSTSTKTNQKQNYINQIATLLKHDFAFVKRSNGLFSYAILAYRTNPGRTNPGNKSGNKSGHGGGGGVVNNSDDYYNGEYKEEGMAFVMDDVGSTKMIRKKHWFEYIRLVSMDDLSCDEEDDSGMGEEGDYGMGEGLNNMTTCHPDVNLSYQQFKTRTTTRQGDPQDDPQDNVPQDMLCQEIPQVCQEVNPQVYQEQGGEEEMFEFEEDEPFLPDMISFDPTSGENEDCSLISSVSDRARRANSSRVWR